MRRFTLLTLLYLAVGVCLTAIAFGAAPWAIALQPPETTPSLTRVLLVNAGLLYLFAVFSTFRFWQQGFLNSQRRLRQSPTWRQKLNTITPWSLIAVALLSFIFAVLSGYWATDAIAQAASGLTLILLYAEGIASRSQASPNNQ